MNVYKLLNNNHLYWLRKRHIKHNVKEKYHECVLYSTQNHTFS